MTQIQRLAFCLLVGVLCTLVTLHSVQAEGTVFAVDIGFLEGGFISFPAGSPSTPALISATEPDASTGSLFAMDFDSLGNTLYGINNDDRAFGTISTADGTWSTIGNITGLGSAESVTGMSVDPTDETFYVSATDAVTSNLYTLNPGDQVATLVGAIGTALQIDIAIDANGQMYGHDIADDMIYRIDKTDGSSVAVGPTGVDANFAQGMDFDYSTNTLYAILYEGGGANQYSSINVNTGFATEITPGTPLQQGEFEMAINAPIPEPSTLGLGCLALVSLMGLRRR